MKLVEKLLFLNSADKIVFLCMPRLQLAVQLAVLIAKIFRLDMPKLWPDLLPHLIQVRMALHVLLCETLITNSSS